VLWVELSIRSVISAISPFVDKLMLLIKRCQCAQGGEIEVEVSLREALANAVVHGNHEDPDKHVYVVCRCTPDGEVSIVVSDEGEGFNCTELPNPTAAEHLQSTHGRGIYLMTSLMDEVHFERGGSVVHMRKRSTNSDHPRSAHP
jgi:serine/threonine-protein kinase RsbW